MSWTGAVGIVGAAAAILLAGCMVQAAGGGPSPQDREDIVYLRNGQELRGIIVERVPGTSLSLRSRQGTVWFLQEEDIQRVEERSVASARAPGMPVVRMTDSKLVHQWVRIDAGWMGTFEGRVLRMDPDTLFMREAEASRKTKLPRAAIRDVVVSTRQSRRTAAGAAEKGLMGVAAGAFMGLFVLRPLDGAAIVGAMGVVMGAALGSLEVEHKAWRRLDLNPTTTAPPVSSVGIAVGVRVRP